MTPTRPGDIPHTASLRELLDVLHAHQGRLVDARHGIGNPVPAEQLAQHAIALLAVQHALADRVLASRWVTVAECLTYGAKVDQVATAMSLDVDEVRVGLTSWADGQLRYGYITEAQHAAVLELLQEGNDPPPSQS